MSVSRYRLTHAMLLKLNSIAKARNEVAMITVKSGHTVFVEPTHFGAVLGIGLAGQGQHPVRMEIILQRRFENPARFGSWLPARMKDQSSFLLRRLTNAECTQLDQLARIDLAIPLELLAA